MQLIDNLSELEANGASAQQDDDEESDAAPAPALNADSVDPLPVVLCVGSRGPLDEVAASMLSTLLERDGISTRVLPPTSLYSSRLKDVDLGDADVVVLSYMNADSMAHARFLVRRLRRRLPNARFIAGFWTLTPSDISRRDPQAATQTDAIATSFAEAVREVLGRPSPIPSTEDRDQQPRPVLVAAAGS